MVSPTQFIAELVYSKRIIATDPDVCAEPYPRYIPDDIPTIDVPRQVVARYRALVNALTPEQRADFKRGAAL
jgi:hypothetical protein